MPPDPDPEVPSAVSMAARAALGLVAVAAGVTHVGGAFHRYLVNDDYALLYTSWQESLHHVPGKDYVVYGDHALTHLLAPLMRAFPGSLAPLFVARLAMVLCLAATSVIVFRVTRRLCGVRSAWFAPSMFLTSVLVLNRALDVRCDLLTTLLWTVELDLLTAPVARAPRDRMRRLLVAGAVLGLMPVNFFKSALAVPFFFALIALRGLLEAEPRPLAVRLRGAAGDVAIAALASLVPVALYVGWLEWVGALGPLVDASRAFFGSMAGAPDPTLPRVESFRLLFAHDPWICLAIGAGIVLRVDRLREHAAFENAAVLVLLALGVASVMLNPSYYAYNFVTLLPLLAPFGGYACARVLRAAERSAGGAGLAALVALALLLGPLVRRLHSFYEVGFVPTNTHQIALHRYLTGHAPSGAGLFSLAGVGLFRPGATHFWLTALVQPRYAAGEWSYERELRERPPLLVLKSYRLPAWLTPHDRDFVATHYADLNADFMVPGASRNTAGQGEIELLVPGVYEVATSGPCRLDGRSVAEGERVEVAARAYSIETGGRCGLRLVVDPAGRALLEERTRIPYLVGPDFLVW